MLAGTLGGSGAMPQALADGRVVMVGVEGTDRTALRVVLEDVSTSHSSQYSITRLSHRAAAGVGYGRSNAHMDCA